MRPPRTLTKEYQRILGRLEAAESILESTREAALEHQQQVANIATYKWQLESIDFSARLFDPDWDAPIQPIRAKADPVGNGGPGAIIREALRVLGAATVPMTAREIVLAIGPTLVENRDLTPEEITQLTGSISTSLTTRRAGFIHVTADKPRRFSLARR